MAESPKLLHSSAMDLSTRLWGRHHVPQNVFLVMTKNNRPMIRGTCAECERTKTQFISKSGGDVVSKLGIVTSNIKLP